MGYLDVMTFKLSVPVLFLLLASCSSSGPPLEEACEPLRVDWEKKLKSQLERDIRSKIAAEVASEPIQRGPKLSDSEREALKRAAGQSERKKSELSDTPLIEGTPAPDKLTAKDRAALADDPANGPTGRIPSPPKPRAESTGGVTHRPGVSLREGTENLKLVDLVIGLAVEDRQPVSPANSFTTGADQFFCYSVYNSAVADQVSTHVWRANGKVLSRVELKVGKSPSWRTWSRHRTRPGDIGKWTCEVLDTNGAQLGLAQFTVGK
jgi:hypothetical protein